jgi:hypothetical protein
MLVTDPWIPRGDTLVCDSFFLGLFACPVLGADPERLRPGFVRFSFAFMFILVFFERIRAVLVVFLWCICAVLVLFSCCSRALLVLFSCCPCALLVLYRLSRENAQAERKASYRFLYAVRSCRCCARCWVLRSGCGGRVGVRYWFAVEMCNLGGFCWCVVGFFVRVDGVLLGFLSGLGFQARSCFVRIFRGVQWKWIWNWRCPMRYYSGKGIGVQVAYIARFGLVSCHSVRTF